MTLIAFPLPAELSERKLRFAGKMNLQTLRSLLHILAVKINHWVDRLLFNFLFNSFEILQLVIIGFLQGYEINYTINNASILNQFDLMSGTIV